MDGVLLFDLSIDRDRVATIEYCMTACMNGFSINDKNCNLYNSHASKSIKNELVNFLVNDLLQI